MKIRIWTQEESLNNVCLFIMLITDSGHHIIWKCFASDIEGRILHEVVCWRLFAGVTGCKFVEINGRF